MVCPTVSWSDPRLWTAKRRLVHRFVISRLPLVSLNFGPPPGPRPPNSHSLLPTSSALSLSLFLSALFFFCVCTPTHNHPARVFLCCSSAWWITSVEPLHSFTQLFLCQDRATEDFLDHLHNFSLEEKKLVDMLSARGASLPSSLSSMLTKDWVEHRVRLPLGFAVLVPDHPMKRVRVGVGSNCMHMHAVASDPKRGGKTHDACGRSSSVCLCHGSTPRQRHPQAPEPSNRCRVCTS